MTDLPFGYVFRSVSFSKRLIVSSLLEEMNNTSIFFVRQESVPAKLIVMHDNITNVKLTKVTMSKSNFLKTDYHNCVTLQRSRWCRLHRYLQAATTKEHATQLPVVTQLQTPLFKKEQPLHDIISKTTYLHNDLDLLCL